MATFISATPHRGQKYQRCVERPEVEDAWMALSSPGHLTVKLRAGIPDDGAEEIAECLRHVPGEPWIVDVKRGE